MNKIDLEHKLLKGSPIYLGDVPIYSITLGQMVDFQYSYTMCNYIINILCIDDDKVSEMLPQEIEKTTLNMVLVQMYAELLGLENGQIPTDKIDQLLVITLPPFLKMLFRNEVNYDFNNMCFVIGSGEETRILDKNNYDDFRNILKERNCLMDVDGVENDDNPDNDMARKLLEKRKKLREKVRKAKLRNGEDDEGLTLADLISIFAEAEKIPLQDVYDKYDIYQFNNQFNRLKIMEDYQVNIKALLAGAKSEEVKLQHWLSKIKKQEE